MPLTKLPILPGVFKDNSPLDAEGYVIDANLVRVVMGKWQTVGGWELATASAFDGIARGGTTWADLNGTRILAFGTAAKLYAFYGGELKDITPEQKAKGTLVDPFETTSGSPTVLVHHPSHGLKGDGTAQASDTVTFSGASNVGGVSVNGSFLVTIVTVDSYRITASSNATSSAVGGGATDYTVPFDAGLVDGIGGLGYGAGPYGSGLYGVATSGDIHARVWSMANWGHNLLALPTNGALYEWQPAQIYAELVTNGAFDTDTGWTKGGGWTISGGKANATTASGDVLSQDLTGILSGGVTYVLKATVTRTGGSSGITFKVTSAASSTPQDFTIGEPMTGGDYVRRFVAPPNPTLIKFEKGALFAGTLDNVSITIEDVAYRIQDAPPYAKHMFVDPNRFVVLLGTVGQNGEYSSTLIRWCDQENNRTWTAADDVKAGEYAGISQGSEIRGALAARGQNLIWTDAALYSMRYVGGVDTFRFDFIASGCGLIHKNAATEYNGSAFWWSSNENFMIFQGGNPQILPCPVRRDVMDNLALGQESKISCGVNASFSEVWWCYPDRRDGAGLECSRIVVYNWAENCWTIHKLARSQWMTDGVYPTPIGLSPDGRIYFHEFGQTDNGDALAWELTTAYLDLGEGDTLMQLEGCVPDFEDQVGLINIEVATKAYPNAVEKVYPAKPLRTNTLKSDWRHTARQARFRFFGMSAPAFMRFGALKMRLRQTSSIR